MITLLKKRPWLLIVAAFLFLIGAWSVLITLSVRNQPEAVPLDRYPTRTADD